MDDYETLTIERPIISKRKYLKVDQMGLEKERGKGSGPKSGLQFTVIGSRLIGLIGWVLSNRFKCYVLGFRKKTACRYLLPVNKLVDSLGTMETIS